MIAVRSKLAGRYALGSVALAAGVAGLLAFASPTLATADGPRWAVTSVSRPTNFKAGDESGKDSYRVTVTNTGGATSTGPIEITDELPAGISLDPAGASGENPLAGAIQAKVGFSCALRTCTYAGAVVPGQTLDLTFPVDVSAGPFSDTCEVPEEALGCLTNIVRVTGGSAPVASVSTPTVISERAASFGISPGGASTALSSSQAGAHPDFTTSIAFNTVSAAGSLAGDPKDTVDDLPPGFAGDLVDTPSCSAAQFALNGCPIGTQVGVVSLTFNFGAGRENEPPATDPVYKLSPNPGEAAKLGFWVAGNLGVQGGISLRPDDYGLRATFENVKENLLELDTVSLTVWGVPADPIHDPLRYSGGNQGHFGVPSDASRAPFFTNPTSCAAGQLEATFSVTSWQRPDPSENPAPTRMPFGPIVGCDRLTIEPSLTVEATTSRAYSPTGLDLAMKIPQTYDNPDGLATSTLKRAIVALPEGMTVNPSAGAGLGACSPQQFAEEAAQFVLGRGCTSTSKLGTVKIHTPVLSEEVNGSVFLAEPAPFGESGKNPFNSLLALYIVARLPERGILVKAAGEVSADPLTGRLVTTFDDLPPLPFDLFTFRFNQGQTSPLVTPPGCGQYAATAQLTPYATPSEMITLATPPFPISSAFDGGACPSGGVPPFAPQVTAGTLNNNAGAYSPMDIRIIRADGEQEITGFSSQLPSGLTANLSGVPFCSEAAIALARAKTGGQEEAEPSCPAQSQIGHTLVGAGVGQILAQAAGKIYMAGPFEGSPFSIAAITSAKVGPFDLGTVVVHLPLQINPLTAAVSVAAGGSDQIPHIIRGIVIHVRDIRVYIDKPNFTLNPTSCERQTFAATVFGSGASFTNPADDVPVTVTDPFQAADCQALKFAPKFAVSTNGKTSRANGASLTAKLTYPNAPQGTQANIRSVKVDLPKQLPSRLTTLQKACPDSVFNANPAACPAASVVGHATAITPILPVPLIGPAYFVSHGGAKFPELIVVLQGYGVTLDLHGETFISKTGITSSTFRTVPDDPIGSFELTLPQGKFSALAANGNLCTSKLAMPTAFVAQNGAVIKQSTPIGVTGCAPAIRVVGHSVKGSHASIRVTVPAAGTLVASGGDIERSVRRVAKAGTVTIGVTLSSQRLRVLAKNPHQRVNAKVNLRFGRKHGAPLTTYVRLLMG